MGLPLFVASVESDISSKSATKGISSPSRSGIRRLGRPDSRDRRGSTRLANVRIYGAHPPRASRSNLDGILPWVEPPDRNVPSPRPQLPPLPDPQEAVEPPWHGALASERRYGDPFENQMASVFGSNWRQRRDIDPFEDQMTSIFGSNWRQRRDISTREYDRVSRRAQLLASLDRGDSPPSDRANVPPASYSTVAIMTRNSAPRYNARLLREGRRPALGRHAPGVDGLGDRDRSLSPEVWDTLLSTLTPDPQPPSAGSSFSSAPSFTHPAERAHLNRVTSRLANPDELLADAHCDSGDHSDTSTEDEAEIRRRRIRQEARNRMPRWNGSRTPSSGQRPAGGSRRALTPVASNRVGDGATARGMPLARLLNSSVGAWAGQGSGEEASEEEGGSVNRRQPANNNSGDGPSAPSAGSLTAAAALMSGLGSEDEWSGMRHIVSGLARREDIPDECGYIPSRVSPAASHRSLTSTNACSF
ncbi:hypothetical protein GQ602_006875 [Ophiocordyceps camponoti-floridani]|uniref:Uncharacterized protein n=1 Tax=Ophiocordyceps camponoti-floridani TaxID=2030778 RepID=A0A8H4Q277_9HYPO|nr:hypothetical protein GQ602_006875 [Ophiocordyceps camponoti-floridani]